MERSFAIAERAVINLNPNYEEIKLAIYKSIIRRRSRGYFSTEVGSRDGGRNIYIFGGKTYAVKRGLELLKILLAGIKVSGGYHVKIQVVRRKGADWHYICSISWDRTDIEVTYINT